MRTTLFTIPFVGLDVPAFGVMMMLGVVIGTWWASKRAEKVKCDGELIVNLGLLILVSSIIGARLFYVIHYWNERFAGQGLLSIINVRRGGLEFYGGFIGAVVAVAAVLWYRKLSLRLYLDIMVPSLALGLAFGRMGCFLHGCCWGSVCPPTVAWAVQFPYESPPFHRHWENRLVTVPAELIYVWDREGSNYGRAELNDPRNLIAQRLLAPDAPEVAIAAHLHSQRVHPSQVYASIGGLLLAGVLHQLFFHRKRHGVVFGAFLILYPLMRFVEEAIRGDNPLDTFYLTVSQFVSLALIGVGLVYLAIMYRLPLRSPHAAAMARLPEGTVRNPSGKRRAEPAPAKGRRR